MAARSRLQNLLSILRRLHGVPPAPPVRDPYLLLLWEQVAYLADDATHLAAWRLLETTVGTAPDEIMAATDAALRRVTRRGGSIAPEQRAERLRKVARRVLGEWDGNLTRALKSSLAAARKELTKYPSIGEAGAERILALSGIHPVLGLDSNAVRVLQRLGYGADDTDWNRAYRSARDAAARELPRRAASLAAAYLALRHHGRTVCKRSAPRCAACPIRGDCPTGRATVRAS